MTHLILRRSRALLRLPLRKGQRVGFIGSITPPWCCSRGALSRLMAQARAGLGMGVSPAPSPWEGSLHHSTMGGMRAAPRLENTLLPKDGVNRGTAVSKQHSPKSPCTAPAAALLRLVPQKAPQGTRSRRTGAAGAKPVPKALSHPVAAAPRTPEPQKPQEGEGRRAGV